MHNYAIHCLTSEDPRWGHLFRIPRPPDTLWARGTPEALHLLERLPNQGLAIVGTRQAQGRSLGIVNDWISALRGSDLIILSGLARGIDTAAHEAALEAGLPTIAILGSGVESIYPRDNLPLARAILASGGLLISELPLDATIYPSTFLQRNRIIALWSKAVWVVQAGARSGALNTAKWARESDRFCFATPCFPGDPVFAGNQGLLDRDEALPLWAPHGFGAAWLDLSSRSTEAEATCPLEAVVRTWTRERGAAPIAELLQWALNSGWTHPQFYLTLDAGLAEKRFYQQGGTIISTGKSTSSRVHRTVR